MIDLHTVATPNGHKVSIMLEEVGFPYRLIPYNLFAGDQFGPALMRLNPNHKLPVIEDHAPADGGEPHAVFESGAILAYLAEKAGRFGGQGLRQRSVVLQWLMYQMAGLGPMHGQAHHFIRYAPDPHDYATRRYLKESHRLLAVMDGHLAGHEYLAGADYTIADIACWPWIRAARLISIDLGAYPQVGRWFQAIAQRPAVVRGGSVIDDSVNVRPASTKIPLDERQWSNLFGARQHANGKTQGEPP